MKFIGITGGVGAGKSAVLSHLSQKYNCKIIMADDLAKTLMEPKTQCFSQIVSKLVSNGFVKSENELLDSEGNLDKSVMSQVVFASAEGRAIVNAIVHPAVKDWVLCDVENEREKGEIDYYFFEAALMLECDYDKVCDEVWYIFTSEENRRARLKENRGYSDDKVDNIFASQLTEEEFRSRCKFVVDNNSSPQESFEQIDEYLTINI